MDMHDVQVWTGDDGSRVVLRESRDGCREVVVSRPGSGEPEVFRSSSRVRLGALAVGATAMGSLALGATALGALAVGAAAVGVLAVGRLHVKKARVDLLEIGELRIEEGPSRSPARPRSGATSRTAT